MLNNYYMKNNILKNIKLDTREKIYKDFMIEPISEDTKFYMIAQNSKGLFSQKTHFISIPIKDERFDLFYGSDFPHDKLKKFITGKTENLMLLHGDPGTGKSNYIKHIIIDKGVVGLALHNAEKNPSIQIVVLKNDKPTTMVNKGVSEFKIPAKELSILVSAIQKR